MSIELDDTMYFQHASKEAESPQEILQTLRLQRRIQLMYMTS